MLLVCRALRKNVDDQNACEDQPDADQGRQVQRLAIDEKGNDRNQDDADS